MKIEEKKSRSRIRELEDYLRIEPYHTIIRILQLAPTYYPEFREGLQTKELRYLIQGDFVYEHGKGFRGKGKTPLVVNLKKRLISNKEIKLNQNISKTYQGFNKYLEKLEESGWITRESGYIKLSQKKNILALKHLYLDNIKSTDTSNIIPLPNISYLFPNKTITINDILPEDLKKIHDLTSEINEILFDISMIFGEVGKCKGFQEVVRVIENLDIDYDTRIVLFILLITRMTCEDLEMEKLKTINGKEVLNYLTHTRYTQRLYNEILKPSILRFLSDKLNLTEKIERYDKLLNLLYLVILEYQRSSMRFIATYESSGIFNQSGILLTPEILSNIKTVEDCDTVLNHIKSNQDKEYEIDIDTLTFPNSKKPDMYKYVYEKLYEDIMKDKERIVGSNYFPKTDFLQGYEDKLKSFGITKEEVYKRMDYWLSLNQNRIDFF